MLRAEGSDPGPRLGGPWPLPGPSPFTINWDCRRAFLPPLLVRWAGPTRGKGRGWGPPCAGEAGRGTAGPHLARAQRDQMEQKAAFHPARGGATLFSSRQEAPEDFGGTNTPTLVRDSRKLARGWNLVQVPSRWNLGYPPVAQVAKRLLHIYNSCPGPNAQVHPGAAPVTWPAPSHAEEARLREGKCTARK